MHYSEFPLLRAAQDPDIERMHRVWVPFMHYSEFPSLRAAQDPNGECMHRARVPFGLLLSAFRQIGCSQRWRRPFLAFCTGFSLFYALFKHGNCPLFVSSYQPPQRRWGLRPDGGPRCICLWPFFFKLAINSHSECHSPPSTMPIPMHTHVPDTRARALRSAVIPVVGGRQPAVPCPSP
jgi:hypothetical protein